MPIAGDAGSPSGLYGGVQVLDNRPRARNEVLTRIRQLGTARAAFEERNTECVFQPRDASADG